MTAPTVTVVMSVYNGEKDIRKAIDSILDQTFSDFEFFIINDGSTDTSKKIILSYNDSRIHLIENEKNIGLTPSLIKGLQLAKGTYIARIDIDDVAMPQRFREQVNMFNQNQQLGLLGTWYYEVSDTQKIKKTPSPDSVILRWNLLFGTTFGHFSVMIRSEAYRDVGGYNPACTVAQDYELWSRIARKWEIGMVPKILGTRRICKGSISLNKETLQQESAEQTSIRNLLLLTKGQLSWEECVSGYMLMERGLVPDDKKKLYDALYSIKTFVTCFIDTFPNMKVDKKVKFACVHKLLNNISPSCTIAQRLLLYRFAFILTPFNTLCVIVQKIIKNLCYYFCVAFDKHTLSKETRLNQ
ncbi:MAG: glycosyltransferase [Candidatus Omnitrophica bacterium]|nr:glycosyltransferase [Candidatus Omnitrophota bacterium]